MEKILLAIDAINPDKKGDRFLSYRLHYNYQHLFSTFFRWKKVSLVRPVILFTSLSKNV